jgi:hypothetical protein
MKKLLTYLLVCTFVLATTVAYASDSDDVEVEGTTTTLSAESTDDELIEEGTSPAPVEEESDESDL